MKYQPAPVPAFEIPRLKELYSLNVLDSAREQRFDRYVRLAVDIFAVPIANIVLMDAKRELYKASCGVNRKGAGRKNSFCAYTILEKEALIVPDTLKYPPFAENIIVTKKPKIRFYAGAVLRGPTGQPVGTLCLMDKKPHKFSKKQTQTLVLLAKMVEHELQYNYYLTELEKNIESNLYYDPITQTPNKRLFIENLKKTILANKNQTPEVTVVVLQMRRYDELFQAYGRKTITNLVKQIAARIKIGLSNFDGMVAHEYDHFMFFFSGSPKDRLAALSKALLDCFQNPFDLNNKKLNIDACLGISRCPQDGRDPNILLEKAIAAMQSGIASNTNYKVFSTDTRETLARDFDLTHRLQKALANNKLQVHYQPKIDLATGKICGAEALTAWQGEDNEMISPDIFIALAEKNNLIVPLTQWLLQAVANDIKHWMENKIPLVPIAINLPSAFLQLPDMVMVVKEFFLKNKLLPAQISFEITESCLQLDIKDTIKKMLLLHQWGSEFAIDDFGTGYSSFGYLSQLPVQAIKIDKSFITDITTNPANSMLVHSIIDLSKKLKLDVIAEGVENTEQLAILKNSRCDQIQGYLFSRAVHAAVFGKMLQEGRRLLEKIT